MMKKILALLFFLIFSTVSAIDLPNFYKASQFQESPPRDLDDWASKIELRYSQGSSRTGYDSNEKTTPLLNIYGAADINKLAINIENLTAPGTRPNTYNYLRETNGIIPLYGFTGNDGKIELTGQFKLKELDLELRQNIFHGFFARAYLPYRKINISNIGYINKTSTSNANATNFQNFLDNTLDLVLQENNLLPLTTPFKKSTLGDINLSLGWQGEGKDIFGYIKELHGLVEAGIILPTAPKLPNNRVVGIPLGYDGFLGFNMRLEAEAKYLSWISFGFYGDGMIFLGEKRTKRMKTDLNQSGLILLEQGFVDVDPGSLWDLCLYTKLTPLIKGLFIIAGYSYTKKEISWFRVKDDNFLSTYIAANAATVPRPTKEEIVNSDDKLKEWSQHVIHIKVGYNAAEHFNSDYIPSIFLFYDLPILGRRTFKAEMFGGGASLAVNWDF